MQLGDKSSITRSFSADDLAAFHRQAGIQDSAIGSVPEPLIGALFSYLLGVELPGFGTNYLKQEMQFLHPAPIGLPLTASVEITRLRPDKHLVDLRTVCAGPDGKIYCEGRALVLAKDVGK